MTTPENSFKTSLSSIISEIEKIKKTPSKAKEYTQRLSDIDHKFDSYHEEVTPRPVLSNMYTCVGRMKFYGDKMLFIHLEILDNENVQRLWPVKATWKVELIDDDDFSADIRTYTLGEATCLFNKPKQGFSSHPNDWISIRYKKIQQSGLIATDNSMTIKWSVLVEPVLQNIYLEQFEQLLRNAEHYFDFFNGGEIQRIQDGLSEIRNKSQEHETKITILENLLPNITEKLNAIEQKQESMDSKFNKIMCKIEHNNTSNNNNNITTSGMN